MVPGVGMAVGVVVIATLSIAAKAPSVSFQNTLRIPVQ